MNLLKRPLLATLLFALTALTSAAARAADDAPYARREDVMRFVADMAATHNFDPVQLSRLFDQLVPQPGAIKAIMPPKDPRIRSWQAYRARYIEPKRIGLGLQFWETYRPVLEEAARRYGVPEEIIAAIIGVETLYGRNMGNFPTLATLATLAFDYPPRTALFRSELEAFLLLQRERNADPLETYGSYAGAIGLPQFLPSSIRRFAVDFDENGQIDLRNSPADAIGSVANFLSAHGWKPGEPVAVPAAVLGSGVQQVADGSVAPRYTVEELLRYQVFARKPVPADALCAVIDLVTPGGQTEYWLGLQNFYVITRYNRSSFYAMAVYELSRELRAAWDAGHPQ